MLSDFGVAEAEIYLKCLQYQQGLSVEEISQYVNREAYVIHTGLGKLMQKGLIEKHGDRYLANAPEEILNVLKDTFPGMFLMLPLLSGIKTASGKSFHIRFFNGEDGIRQIHEDILGTLSNVPDEQRFLFQVSSSDDLFDLLPDHQESFINRRVENNILLYWMAPQSEENLQHALQTDENLRIARFFDGVEFPFNIELDVYGDKVAIVALDDDEICGVIIEIPTVATSIRSICRILWESLHK